MTSMLDTNRDTDLVSTNMSRIHNIVFHCHTTQNNILRSSLVNLVHTSMYQYVLRTYSYKSVEQHVLYLETGAVYVWLGTTKYSFHTPSITSHSPKSKIRQLTYFQESIVMSSTYQDVPVLYPVYSTEYILVHTCTVLSRLATVLSYRSRNVPKYVDIEQYSTVVSYTDAALSCTGDKRVHARSKNSTSVCQTKPGMFLVCTGTCMKKQNVCLCTKLGIKSRTPCILTTWLQSCLITTGRTKQYIPVCPSTYHYRHSD